MAALSRVHAVDSVPSCAVAMILTLLLMLLSDAQASGDIIVHYNTQTGAYTYEVTNLPDLDQMRDSGQPPIIGLPNQGAAYCVPTSSMDVLAYIANHGFPSVTPGVGNWQAAWRYNLAGTAIRNLGINMSTHATNGTTKSYGFFGIVGFPSLSIPAAVPTGKITAVQNFKSGSSIPRFSNMTKGAILSGGLVTLCHGWYNQTGVNQGVPIVVRDGGHCLALEAVTGCSGCTLDVRLRDPGDDQSALYTQSAFASAQASVVGRPVHLGAAGFPAVDVSEILPTALNSVGDPIRRILDSYIVIFTTKGYWFTADQNLVKISYFNPQNLAGSIAPLVQHFPIVNGVGTLVDVAMTPDLDGFVYIAGTRVYRMDPLDATSSPITAGDPLAPTKVMFGRSRGLYLIDGPQIKLLDIDASPPQAIISRLPPNPCSHMVYDDATDRVIAMSTSARTLFQYDRGLENDPAPLVIPANVPLTGQVGMAINPLDGSMWISSSDFPGAWRLEFDPDGNVLSQGFTLPAVQNPQAIEVDDAGVVHLSAGGIVRAFQAQGNALIEVPNAPFAGLTGGPMLKLTHSRTNFEPGEHDTPAWRDVLATEFAPPLPDCVGDIAPGDGDRAVNVADLLKVITSWGPCPDCRADLSPTPGGDGNVGVADLLTVITRWGACPSNLPPRAADACAAPNAVSQGTYAFTTASATTDGPALPVACDEGFGLSLEKDIWLRYSPTASGTLVVSTCGTAGFDTRMAAYTGACGALTLIACNDDGPGCPGVTSLMQALVIAGQPVLIRLGGYGGASGTGTVTLSQ